MGKWDSSQLEMHCTVFAALLVGCCLAFGTGLPYEDHRPQARFGEGIRDWLRNVRDRVFGRQTEKMLEKAQADRLHDQQKNPSQESDHGRFFLDLSTLSFDPQKDWGFRVGHWYFVRKGDRTDNDYPPPSLWDVPYPSGQQHPDDSEWEDDNELTPPVVDDFGSTTVRTAPSESAEEPGQTEPNAATGMKSKEEDGADDDEPDDEPPEAQVLIP